MKAFFPALLIQIFIISLPFYYSAQSNDSLTKYLSKTETYLQYEPEGKYLYPRYWVNREPQGTKAIDGKKYQEYVLHYQVKDSDTLRSERIFEHISAESIEWRTGDDGYILKLNRNSEQAVDGIIDGNPGKVISRPLFSAQERNVDTSLVPRLFMLEHDTNIYAIYRKELKKVELIYSPDRMLKLMIGEGFSELAIKDRIIDAFVPKMLVKPGEHVELTFKQPIIAENGKDIRFENQLLLRATYVRDSIIDDMPAFILKSEKYDYAAQAFIRLKDMYIAEVDSGFLIDGARFIHKYKTGSNYRIIDPQAEPYFNYYDFMDEPKSPFAQLNVARTKAFDGHSLIYHTQWKSNSDYQVTFVNGFPLPFYENASFQGEISYMEQGGAKFGKPFQEVPCESPGMIRYVEAQPGKVNFTIEMKSKGIVSVQIKDMKSNQDIELLKDKVMNKGRIVLSETVPGVEAGKAYKLIFTAKSGKQSHSQRIDFMPR
ncbi:MAG: hypothetical protein ACK4GL_01085 [Flavobacteriales bacterium]